MKRLLAIILLLPGASLMGQTWEFKTPPSAIRRTQVNADWRQYRSLELELLRLSPAPKEPLLCTLFFETKQDWWFESRRTWVLDGSREKFRFSLSLGELSPDWQAATKGCRTFGPDTLRWVRCWGIKVFSAGEQKMKLHVGKLKLIPRKPERPEILDLELPKTPSADRLNPVRFRLGGFYGNWFNSAEIRGQLVWHEDGRARRAPVYYRQGYARVRRPGVKEPGLQALERPVWQANFTPAKAAEYQLTLELTIHGQSLVRKLGPVKVGPPVARAGAARGGNTDFLKKYAGPQLYRYGKADWQYPDPERRLDKYWRAQLDWTPAWGHYTGLGEFEQQIAWRLEQEIRTQPSNQSWPLLLFSEDELDNHGIYNWSDHPLNEENGGELDRAAELFNSKKGARLMLDRARYLWARYGALKQVSGLLIVLNRPQDAAVNWVQSISATLAAEFPGIRLFCNNPGLPARFKTKALRLVSTWQTDRRLSPFSFITANLTKREVILEGRYPGSTAMISKKLVHHWAGASVFAVDIRTSEAAGNEVKVMCFLRTDSNTVYQSRLLWLREDDWNRVYFPLDRSEFWSCLQDPKRRLAPWELLNIREIGLRFFCDEANEVMLNVRNSRLLWPYQIEAEKWGKLRIVGLKAPRKKVPQYSKFELDFQLNRVFNNPYDPREIDVAITLLDPNGRPLRHPGYYHEPWRLEMIGGSEIPVRASRPGWRARFTPWVPGKYEWRLTAKAGAEKVTAAGAFVCTPTAGKGFVRLSEHDPRMFEFSNGSFFYPIGHNIRSPSDRRPNIFGAKTLANAGRADKQGTRAFESWYKRMKANGENFTRIWMCSWWCGLEWNATYPGYHGLDYYNQQNAARLDRLLELAEKEGIYVNLEPFNHGALSTYIDKDWRHNPLSRTQPGGFLRYATDFFTSAKAQRMHRQKLRYTIARWGYSPAIAFWGIITETEWVEPYFRGLGWVNDSMLEKGSHVPRPYKTSRHMDKMRKWLVETGEYLHQTDAHPHPVTTHFSNPQNGLEMWKRDNIQIVHNNAYTMFAGIWQRHRFKQSNGVADVINEYGRFFGRYQRPLLIGEWGGHPERNRESHLIAELHTGLWASFMSNISGITGYWWWNLIDAYDLYYHFKAVAAFAEGEDRRGKDYVSARADLKFPAGGSSSLRSRRRGLVLYNRHELFAYIYSQAINTHNRSTVVNSFTDPTFPESGAGALEAPITLANGRYRLEYWNTFTGKLIKTGTITLADSKRKIPIISHRVDLALKVKSLDRKAKSPRPSGRPTETGTSHEIRTAPSTAPKRAR